MKHFYTQCVQDSVKVTIVKVEVLDIMSDDFYIPKKPFILITRFSAK